MSIKWCNIKMYYGRNVLCRCQNKAIKREAQVPKKCRFHQYDEASMFRSIIVLIIVVDQQHATPCIGYKIIRGIDSTLYMNCVFYIHSHS